MRLIDADEALKVLVEWYSPKTDVQRKWLQEAVKSVPTVDAVEVVRCKDCKHRDPEDKKCDCGEFERAGCIFAVDDDYFCRYGERRMK